MKLKSISKRGILPTDTSQPLELDLAKYGFHRTDKWEYVENYEIIDSDQIHRCESTPEYPIYTVEGYRDERHPLIVIYKPFGKMKYCYFDKE
jgi:hypothetical protein